VVAGTPGPIGTNPLVSLSTGNTITWVGATTSAYCLVATSSKVAATTKWYYSSDNGGISKTACTALAP
jgi:hypothetical protein